MPNKSGVRVKCDAGRCQLRVAQLNLCVIDAMERHDIWSRSPENISCTHICAQSTSRAVLLGVGCFNYTSATVSWRSQALNPWLLTSICRLKKSLQILRTHCKYIVASVSFRCRTLNICKCMHFWLWKSIQSVMWKHEQNNNSNFVPISNSMLLNHNTL